MSRTKAFGVMLGFWFFGLTLCLSVGVLLGLPLIYWPITGVLHFPVSGPELWSLAKVILIGTLVGTVVMWLEGIWVGRW